MSEPTKEEIIALGKLLDAHDVPTEGRYYRYLDEQGVEVEVSLDNRELRE